MSGSVSSGSDSNPRRKRLRKGTHSCIQCRRRKVRCIFESNSSRCENCIARDASCTQQDFIPEKQTSSNRRVSTSRRLRKVEGVLDQILERLPDKATIPLTTGESGQMNVAASLRSASPELPSPSAQVSTFPIRDHSERFMLNKTNSDAPLLGLFDNPILNRQHDMTDDECAANVPVADRTHCRIFEGNDKRILRDLRNSLPNVHDLNQVLRLTQDSWKLWHRVFSDDLGIRTTGSEDIEVGALRDLIYRSLYTEDVAIVAKIILCLTIHLQQLPRDFDYSQCNLPSPSECLQDRYMKSVEELLESEHGLAGTIEGLECMMVQAEFYVNLGKPKKIWLIYRRAVSCAQLLGLHHHSDSALGTMAARRNALWSQIWQTDRELSLVLGLPYAVSDSFLPSETTVHGQKEQIFMGQLGIVTGHIIERNQKSRQMTYPITIQIDQELAECRTLMPKSWWETTPGPHMSVDAIHMMSVMKMRFFNVRKLLHLPFMLKSYTDSQYHSSRLTCLESVREMMKIYRDLRDEQRPALKMCDMVDFQVFTAGMVLVVDLLGHSQSSGGHDPRQETDDWSTIYSIINVFKRVSKAMVCSAAEQAARLLEDFYTAYHSFPALGKMTYEAVVPFFGKIRIERDQNVAPLATSAAGTFGGQGLPDSVANPFEAVTDPFVSFDGYFETLPGAFQPWQGFDANWASNLALGDDWSWFPQGIN